MLMHLILVVCDVKNEKLINKGDNITLNKFTEWKFLKDGNLVTIYKTKELRSKINIYSFTTKKNKLIMNLKHSYLISSTQNDLDVQEHCYLFAEGELLH